jgi:hypothetical protein
MTHSPRCISDYDDMYEPIREARLRNNGSQPGDPDKAASAVLEVINASDPPKHLLLGTAALQGLASGRAAFDEDINRREELDPFGLVNSVGERPTSSARQSRPRTILRGLRT